MRASGKVGCTTSEAPVELQAVILRKPWIANLVVHKLGRGKVNNSRNGPYSHSMSSTIAISYKHTSKFKNPKILGQRESS